MSLTEIEDAFWRAALTPRTDKGLFIKAKKNHHIFPKLFVWTGPDGISALQDVGINKEIITHDPRYYGGIAPHPGSQSLVKWDKDRINILRDWGMIGYEFNKDTAEGIERSWHWFTSTLIPEFESLVPLRFIHMERDKNKEYEDQKDKSYQKIFVEEALWGKADLVIGYPNNNIEEPAVPKPYREIPHTQPYIPVVTFNFPSGVSALYSNGAVYQSFCKETGHSKLLFYRFKYCLLGALGLPNIQWETGYTWAAKNKHQRFPKQHWLLSDLETVFLKTLYDKRVKAGMKRFDICAIILEKLEEL